MSDLFSEFIGYGVNHYPWFYEKERIRFFESDRECIVEIINNLIPETAFQNETGKGLLQKPYQRLALDICMCATPTDKEQQQAYIKALPDMKLKLQTVSDCLVLLQRERPNIAGNLAVKGSCEGDVDGVFSRHDDAISYLDEVRAECERRYEGLELNIAGFKNVQAVVKGEKFIFELMRSLSGNVHKLPSHDIYSRVASAALMTTVDMQASKDAKRKLKKVGFLR